MAENQYISENYLQQYLAPMTPLLKGKTQFDLKQKQKDTGASSKCKCCNET
jgi:hypothetical protein